MADIFIQHFRQRRIRQRQPAARSDAVRDVGKAHREDFGKFGKQRLDHQPGVQLRHAVDLVAYHHRQPRHAYATPVRLVDNRRTAQHRRIVGILLLQGLQEVVVNLENNLQMTRQDFTQHIDGPGLQRFAHQGMVGIGEDLAGHLERLIPAKLMLVNQQAHQLRNRQHRVRIVEVNRDFVRQIGVGFMQLVVTAEDILYRRRHEEILLAQAQLAPGIGGVIRIEHPRHVLRVVFIFHRREVVALVEFTEVDLAAGLRAPQTQRVGGIGVETRDDLIVGFGNNLFGLHPAGMFTFLLNAAAEAHFVARIVALELPRVAVLQPVVRGLFLPPVDDILLKHPVVVANTVAAARQTQRRQRVEEAGSQTTKTAVAQARVVLFVNQLFKIQPHLFQRAVHVLINTER